MIYYLVQGEAYQYPQRMAEMQGSGANIIFLTWNKQIKGALYLPNLTWAQGCNFLGSFEFCVGKLYNTYSITL